MIIEEAINELNFLKRVMLRKEEVEALDMAASILGAYRQIIWERDIAIQQLKDLGYRLGEKPKEYKGDLVSRRALIEGFADMREGYPIITNERLTKKDVINTILSIPPVEDKGEWNVSHTDIDELWATCSNCDEEVKMRLTDDYTPIFYNFCPNCGADMRGGVKSFYDRMTEELGENWDVPADWQKGEDK